jgi:hypothetical protein
MIKKSNVKKPAGLAAATGYERTSTSKKISIKEARKIFLAVALDEKTTAKYMCKSLERTRFWNWFRLGIAVAQTGHISKDDVRWIQSCPWLKPETLAAIKAHNKAIARGTPVTSAEVEKDYGPFSWNW